MSNMYAIKETTLTALGDAVRSKAGVKYKIVDEPTTAPICSLSVNIKEVEPTVEGSITYFETPLIDFKALLGEMYDSTKNLYFSYSYESNIENKFFRNFIWKNPDNTVYFDTTNIVHGLSYSGNLFTPFNSDTGLLRISTNKVINESWEFEFHLDIWACDENNKFIELNKYTPLEMVDNINGLMVTPDEALNISGSCAYKFANGGWDWFVTECGDQITTNNITDTTYMFSNSKVESIPFDINVDITNTGFNNIFNACRQLKEVPYVIGPERTPPTSAYSGTIDLSYMFYMCEKLREIPYDFFWKLIPNKDYWDKCGTVTTKNYNGLFYNCFSLREIPDISMLKGAWTSSYSSIYYDVIAYCCSLNKVNNYPVCGTFATNVFSGFVDYCRRLKDMTFEVNDDGTPVVVKWKSQTIDFTKCVGYSDSSTYTILNYNSGITTDKQVKDDATYQALKNDPDWWTADINYSRYNHDSAVNTINSLPDCSAYGTNTIKFKGDSGALTDGGAINTLTEAEIAVAAAKGWTVSLV